jgi:hypothetical protein
MENNNKLRRILSRQVLCGLFAILLSLLVPLPTLADQPFDQVFKDQGRYGLVSGGVGLLRQTTGNIELDVPGIPVKATLIWAGLGQDNNISLAVDGGAANSLTADTEYPGSWGCCGGELCSYVKDVTTLVQSGAHTYTVTDVTFARDRWGAGLVVVYEDPDLPISEVQFLHGNDGFWHGWTGDLGPNSDVQCFAFEPLDHARDLDVTFVLGGGGAARPNAIWFQTGSGAWPTNLIDLPPDFTGSGSEIAGPGVGDPGTWPFVDADGEEWDTYSHPTAVQVPANDSWACFQVESVDRGQAEDGASIGWLALIGVWTPSQLFSLGDYVWHDENENGIQDADEQGKAGIDVDLYANGDCSGSPIDSKTTDTGGKYLFSELNRGTYCLQFSKIPDGWEISPKDQGEDDALDSDADPTTGRITNINLTADDLDEDMGLYPRDDNGLASLGDYVWHDLDKDGIQDGGEPGVQNVTVELFDCSDDLVDSEKTNSEGVYTFADLEPGCYYLHFVPPPGGYSFTLQDQDTDDTLDSDADLDTGRTMHIDLAEDEHDMTWDAGLHLNGNNGDVPEASTLVLLGSAAAGLVGYASLQIRARRRRS